jgi:hypothetical protein
MQPITTVQPLSDIARILRMQVRPSRDITLPGKPRRARSALSAKDRQLVPAVMKILGEGQPTRFAFEGSCRAGLRAGFCLDGLPWAKSDARAAAIVGEALRRLGAPRPSWQQGQPEWTQEGFAPIERFYCKSCARPIPEERRGRGAKFCSAFCCRVEHQRQRQRFGVRMTRAEYSAMLAARRADARQHRGRPCAHCGQLFTLTESPKPNGHTNLYCSADCREKALAPRPCIVCGEMFTPTVWANALTCSRRCKGQYRWAKQRKTQPMRPCATCGKVFQPARPAGKFCSRACAYVRKRDAAYPARACAACGKEFAPRSPKALYCSGACNNRACRARKRKGLSSDPLFTVCPPALAGSSEV